MKTVVCTQPGVLEVNYMWLPTWIGLNSSLLNDLNQKIASANLVGMTAAKAEILGHEIVQKFLAERYPTIKNLDEHLNSLAAVTEHAQEPSKE